MNLRLRARHRLTWIILLVALPFVLSLAYSIRPKTVSDISSGAYEISCGNNIRSSEFADYYYCDDQLMIMLKKSTRAPRLSVHVNGQDQKEVTAGFAGQRYTSLKMDGYRGEKVTVRLTETLRGDVLDEFQFDSK